MSILDLFISKAYAAGTGGASAAQSPLGSIVFMVAILVIFYFFLLRPQQKKAKEHRKLIDSIEKGDEVVTAGGILGKVTKVGDSFLDILVSEGVEIKVQRPSVSSVMPKGTIKSQ